MLTINDSNLDSCWFEYNGINASRNCTQISRGFLAIEGLQTLTIFANDSIHCPIGKVPMRFQKVLTEQLGDSTQDIFRCPGSTKGNHHGHYCKLSHGTLESGEGIIILTIEK